MRHAGIGLPAGRLARGIAIVARAQKWNCGEQRTTGTPVRAAFGGRGSRLAATDDEAARGRGRREWGSSGRVAGRSATAGQAGGRGHTSVRAVGLAYDDDPNVVCFTSKLIFRRVNFPTAWLHDLTPVELQARVHACRG